jgi:E3 ubiquitin-protein ligase MARCH6
LEPKRIGEILNYPILAVRLITDPIVDFVILGIKDAVFTIAEPYLSTETSSKTPLPPLGPSGSPGNFSSSLRKIAKELNTYLLSSLSVGEAFHVDSFYGDLRNRMNHFWHHSYTKDASFAYGDTAGDRAIAVLLGYGLVLYLAAGYLYLTSAGQLESAARVVRRVLKQQLIVVKVPINNL